MTGYPYPPGHFYKGAVRRRRITRYTFGFACTANAVVIVVWLIFAQEVKWLNIASAAFIGWVWWHSERMHSEAIEMWADDR